MSSVYSTTFTKHVLTAQRKFLLNMVLANGYLWSQRSDSIGTYRRGGNEALVGACVCHPCNASEVVISRMDEPGPSLTPAAHASSITLTQQSVSHFSTAFCQACLLQKRHHASRFCVKDGCDGGGMVDCRRGRGRSNFLPPMFIHGRLRASNGLWRALCIA